MPRLSAVLRAGITRKRAAVQSGKDAEEIIRRYSNMAKISNVLSKVPDITYTEKAPEIDTKEFQKVIETRRAIRVFEKTPIPDEIVDQCLENALLAPNSSNLQPWELYWVKSEEKKAMLVKSCLSQTAARYASELFVVVARTKTWKKHADEMVQLFRAVNTESVSSAIQYYEKVVPHVYKQGFLNIFGLIKRLWSFFRGLSVPVVREPVSKAGVKTWAVKTTALAAENLMLSLCAYGFDSCPMEGYDSKRIKKILSLPNDALIVMVIAAGKRASNGVYGPRMRFDSSRFIKKV